MGFGLSANTTKPLLSGNHSLCYKYILYCRVFANIKMDTIRIMLKFAFISAINKNLAMEVVSDIVVSKVSF